MSTYETGMPKGVTRDQIKAACLVLGIDANNVKQVCIGTDSVEVVAFLRDENGRRHLPRIFGHDAAEGYAKVRETIPVVIGPDATPVNSNRADHIYAKGYEQ